MYETIKNFILTKSCAAVSTFRNFWDETRLVIASDVRYNMLVSFGKMS